MEKACNLPTILLDPKQDPMRGKRFDGIERDGQDEITSYNGNCFCGAVAALTHYHTVQRSLMS